MTHDDFAWCLTVAHACTAVQIFFDMANHWLYLEEAEKFNHIIQVCSDYCTGSAGSGGGCMLPCLRRDLPGTLYVIVSMQPKCSEALGWVPTLAAN